MTLRFLLAALVAASLVLVGPAAAQTGPDVPEMAHYDTFVQNLITQYGIPGASVSVMKDGRLVYARGFGMADPATSELVQPTSRFRVASLSKAISSAAAMRLVDDGLLDLDAPAFALLPDLPVLDGETEDPRLATITVRDLLQHSGGWDRDATGYDPMFDTRTIAAATGEPGPPGCESVIRYMRGRALDFDPGARYAYSNFGYCVLGRVMARASGQSYEAFVRGFLAEADIEGMQIGATRAEDRLPGEVRYIERYNQTCPSVYPPYATVPCPYGEFYIEAMDAHGGWVSSSIDLLRFIRAVDGRGGDDILSPAAIQTMTARPDLSTWNGTGSWYSFGWSVNSNGHWWHTGALNGTRTFMGRMNYRGLAWVVLVNTWPWQNDNAFISALDNGMWNQAVATTTWPTHDFFGLFTAEEDAASATPLSLAAAPNPARGASTVSLTLDVAQTASVAVFDALGRQVARLHDGSLAAGPHAFRLDAARLPTGVYVVRATAGEAAVTQRLTVVR